MASVMVVSSPNHRPMVWNGRSSDRLCRGAGACHVQFIAVIVMQVGRSSACMSLLVDHRNR